MFAPLYPLLLLKLDGCGDEKRELLKAIVLIQFDDDGFNDLFTLVSLQCVVLPTEARQFNQGSSFSVSLKLLSGYYF